MRTTCSSLSPEYIADLIATNQSLEGSYVAHQFPHYRKAAVLVPMFCFNFEWYILYTKRTETVQDHKGQVSFPGGAVEDGDGDLIQTALRETQEETGINPQDVRVLGVLNTFPTITQYLVTPVVGEIQWPCSINPQKNEVSRIFSIPVRWLADPTHYEERWMVMRDGREGNVVFYHEFDGEIVWGITGGITLNLMKILKLHS